MTRYIPVDIYKRKRKWCDAHGWTDLFFQEGKWYAFPPNSVIPQYIPKSIVDYLPFLINFFIFLLYRLLMLIIIYSILKIIP